MKPNNITPTNDSDEQIREQLLDYFADGAPSYAEANDAVKATAKATVDDIMPVITQARKGYVQDNEVLKRVEQAYNHGWVDCQNPLSGDVLEDQLDDAIAILEADAGKLTTVAFKVKHGGTLAQAIKRVVATQVNVHPKLFTQAEVDQKAAEGRVDALQKLNFDLIGLRDAENIKRTVTRHVGRANGELRAVTNPHTPPQTKKPCNDVHCKCMDKDCPNNHYSDGHACPYPKKQKQEGK